MKYLLHPAEQIRIPVRTPSGIVEVPMTFEQFFCDHVEIDKRACASGKSFGQCLKVTRLVKESKPGEVVSFEDADYVFVKAIFDEPSNGYIPDVIKACWDWQQTIVNATDKKPEVITPADPSVEETEAPAS